MQKNLEKIVKNQLDIVWNFALNGCRAYVAELYWEYATVCIAEKELKTIRFFNDRSDAVQFAKKFINEQVR